MEMDDFSSQKSYNFLGNIPDIIHQSTNQTAAHSPQTWPIDFHGETEVF